jgi:hypothetical protein
MRSKYLWDFAEILRIDANALDFLKFWDFIAYAYGIDAHHKQQQKEAEARNATF